MFWSGPCLVFRKIINAHNITSKEKKKERIARMILEEYAQKDNQANLDTKKEKEKKEIMRTFHNTRIAYTVITIINITLATEYTSIKQ